MSCLISNSSLLMPGNSFRLACIPLCESSSLSSVNPLLMVVLMYLFWFRQLARTISKIINTAGRLLPMLIPKIANKFSESPVSVKSLVER